MMAQQAELDLNADEDDKSKLHKEQRKRSEKESRDRRNSDQDYKEPDLDANRDIPRTDKRKSAGKVDDFGSHSGVAPHSDKDSLKSESICFGYQLVKFSKNFCQNNSDRKIFHYRFV